MTTSMQWNLIQNFSKAYYIRAKVLFFLKPTDRGGNQLPFLLLFLPRCSLSLPPLSRARSATSSSLNLQASPKVCNKPLRHCFQRGQSSNQTWPVSPINRFPQCIDRYTNLVSEYVSEEERISWCLPEIFAASWGGEREGSHERVRRPNSAGNIGAATRYATADCHKHQLFCCD